MIDLKVPSYPVARTPGDPDFQFKRPGAWEPGAMGNPLDQFPHLVAICISSGGIPKRPISSVRISTTGLESDGHHHEKHDRPSQAVCLQDIEKLDELQAEGYPLYCGTTGENLTVGNLNVNALPVGTILEFSGGLVIRLTKVRQPCYVLDAINPKLKEAIIGRCGYYAEVVKEGILKAGETIHVVDLALFRG